MEQTPAISGGERGRTRKIIRVAERVSAAVAVKRSRDLGGRTASSTFRYWGRCEPEVQALLEGAHACTVTGELDK